MKFLLTSNGQTSIVDAMSPSHCMAWWMLEHPGARWTDIPHVLVHDGEYYVVDIAPLSDSDEASVTEEYTPDQPDGPEALEAAANVHARFSRLDF